MQHIGSSELRRGLLIHHIDVIRTLAMMVTIGLALVITVSLVFSVAVRAGIAPGFDQQIALNAQYRLVIYNGPSPTCAVIPNPPQHDCFRPGPEPREFSVYYLTPHGVRSLLWFRLPPLCMRCRNIDSGSFGAVRKRVFVRHERVGIGRPEIRRALDMRGVSRQID